MRQGNSATTTEGHESYLPKPGRSETERDSGTSAYSGNYSDERRTENENAYPSANETTGANENPPAARRRTQSPPSPISSCDDPSLCAALHVKDL